MVLSVRDGTGREELRIPVQKMNIGAGEADTIPAEGVAQAYASIVRNPSGGYRVKANKAGTFLFDETSQSPVTELFLGAGVGFRVGDTVIHCLTDTPHNRDADDWSASCPFCAAAMASPAASACPSCERPLIREDAKRWAGWIPTALGSYQIKRFVGCGGMGVVLRGAGGDDLPVAIKLIRSRLPNPTALRRFDDEIDIIRKVPPHPNVVGYRGHGCEEGRLRWLAMEWIEGGTLAERMSRVPGRALPIAEIQSIMEQLARGLGHLQHNGIIHRDLKPANIFVKPDGGVKICDFGIARGIDTGTVLSTTGNMSGTMFYTSPEQRLGERLGPASDIYSLGLVWQQMLTGHNTGGVLNILRTDCPEAWKSTIGQMLAVDPHQRPVVESIEMAIKANAPPPTRAPSTPLSLRARAAWKAICERGCLCVNWCRPRLLPAAAWIWRKPVEPKEGENKNFVQWLKRQLVDVGAWLLVAMWCFRQVFPEMSLVGIGLLGLMLSGLLILGSWLASISESNDFTRRDANIGFAWLLILALVFSWFWWFWRHVYPGLGLVWMIILPIASIGMMITLVAWFQSKRIRECHVFLFLWLTMWWMLPAAGPMHEREGGPKPGGAQDRKVETLEPGEERDFEIAAGVEMTFCWIPPGEFEMGSPAGEGGREDDETQHRVRITRGFWLAKTEVTQAQWQAVMGSNPSSFKGADLPVESVSWDDICGNAQRTGGFLGKVNQHAAGGGRFDLPTEAQWEYACRAGTTGPYAGALDAMAWYTQNSGAKPHPVGGKRANAWGLHDMQGNVWEWCADWYGAYVSGASSDPTGPVSGSYRVLRGGSWYSYGAGRCRAAGRYIYDPAYSNGSVGFRIARSSVP